MNQAMAVVMFFVVFTALSSCQGPLVRYRKRPSAKSQEQTLKNFSGVRKKIILLEFFNESPYGGKNLGKVASVALRRNLERTGAFIIDKMGGKEFGNSKEVYAGGGLKLVQLARKAKNTGANFVIFGRISDARIRERTDNVGIIRETKSVAMATLEIRLFDVNASKEVFTQSLKGNIDDSSYLFFGKNKKDRVAYRENLLRHSVEEAIAQASEPILKTSNRLDWVGRVAKIIGNKVYINAGRESGIQLGDILRVVTEGREIYDPETGALIGTSKGEIKGTIEVIDYFGSDGSVAILHSGGAVVESDFVQLY